MGRVMKTSRMTTDSPPSVVVRRATKDDLSCIGTLGKILVDAHHGFDKTRFLAANSRTPADYARFLGEQLADRTAAIFVADHGGKLIGYTFARLEGHDYMVLRGPAGVVHDLMVAEEHRRRGIGRQLLQAAVAFLRSQGAPRVVLSTAARNEGAQRLFAGMGFRPTMNEMTCELGEFRGSQIQAGV